MPKNQNTIGNGADHAVKLGKYSKVVAGPSYKMPDKKDMAQDRYADRDAEAQT